MVTTVTFTGTTHSATISPLLAKTTYYYQITAFNNTTPGPTSATVSHDTASGISPTNSNNLVLIGGKLYSQTVGGKLQLSIQGTNLSGTPAQPSPNGTVVSTSGPTIYDSNLNSFALV